MDIGLPLDQMRVEQKLRAIDTRWNSLCRDPETVLSRGSLIRKMPEDAALRELQFIAGVREGFEQLERGEGLPAEDVRRMVPEWVLK